jgi:hypothetical protein
MDCLGGWIPTLESWSYASATTITVPSDATIKYNIGDKIRLRQGGSYKYFYIVGVSSTTLTVTGGSDYSVANAIITDNYFSRVVSPLDFPQWFNYDATYTGFSSDPTSVASKFCIIGRQVTYYHHEGGTGTSNNTSFTVSLPVTAQSITARLLKYAGQGGDASVQLSIPSMVEVANGASVVNCYKDFSGAGWTASGGKNIRFTVIYDIA